MFETFGEGSRAQVSNEQGTLRLFAHVNQLGWAVDVYNGKDWFAGERADNEEDAKRKAEGIARFLLKDHPAIVWERIV